MHGAPKWGLLVSQLSLYDTPQDWFQLLKSKDTNSVV